MQRLAPRTQVHPEQIPLHHPDLPRIRLNQEIDVQGTPTELDGYTKFKMANILSTGLVTSCAMDIRQASAHRRLEEYGVHINGTPYINATDVWAIILPSLARTKRSKFRNSCVIRPKVERERASERAGSVRNTDLLMKRLVQGRTLPTLHANTRSQRIQQSWKHIRDDRIHCL